MFTQEINKSLRRKIGQALSNWNMIEAGDRVLAGLSGGKDSLVLLHALSDFQKRSPVKFFLAALSVKITGLNTEILKEYCEAKNMLSSSL